MADGHQQPPGHENAERYVLQTHCVMAMVCMPGRWFLSGGSPREGVRSEARAKQRLAAGGRRLPRPGCANCANLIKSPGSGEAVSPRCARSSWRCECLASLDAHEVDRKRGGCEGG